MDHRVQKVIALLEKNLHHQLSLGHLAQAANLSRWRLCHLFKSEVGVPPAQYLKSIRMRKARELLETTPLSVKQILARVGARDKSHFERDFKKKYGLTPAQYRAQYNYFTVDHAGESLKQTNSKIGYQIAKSAIKKLLLCSVSCSIVSDYLASL